MSPASILARSYFGDYIGKLLAIGPTKDTLFFENLGWYWMRANIEGNTIKGITGHDGIYDSTYIDMPLDEFFTRYRFDLIILATNIVLPLKRLGCQLLIAPKGYTCSYKLYYETKDSSLFVEV